MSFKLKYCKDKDKNKEENKDKTVLTDDAFALCEGMYELAWRIGKQNGR